MDDEDGGIVLPGAEGLGDAELRSGVGRWMRSWAIRELAALSGWRWPETDDVRQLAHDLAALSADWDFRGRAAAAAATNFVERSSMPGSAPLDLNGRAVDTGRVLAAATALQLVSRPSDSEFDPTHVVVLSGTARANVNRTHLAAEVLNSSGYRARKLVALTAHRELGDAERASCTELGLHDTDTEWTTMRDALTRSFGIGGEDARVEESTPDGGTRAARFERSARYAWSSAPLPVELLVVPAPSARAEHPRPANTTDQLRWWVQASDDVTAGAAVLLITTQIYAPYQQLAAARVLRSEVKDCRLLTIGVSAETAVVPTRQFTAADYLQEVRSALIAARDLLDDLAGI